MRDRMEREGTQPAMAAFETPPGQTILPEVHVVLRLVGDRFGRLLADPELNLQRPFDPKFAKWQLHVATDLLRSFEQARFAFVGGDELSLLFGRGEAGFGRGGYRFAIRVAAQASVRLSLHTTKVATFVPHVFQLPTDEWMLKYFLWRQEALTSYGIDRYCRMSLLKSGLDEAAVRRILVELSDSEKLEVLTEHEIDFEAAPSWQRHGVLVWRKPPTAEAEDAEFVIDSELPEAEAYRELLRSIAG